MGEPTWSEQRGVPNSLVYNQTTQMELGDDDAEVYHTAWCTLYLWVDYRGVGPTRGM